MSTDWRELLDRALEGEPLSEAETRALAEALAHAPTRREAAEWLRFEAQLEIGLASAPPGQVALSRERLLAKAALREKGRQVHARSARRVVLRRLAVAAAAAVLAAVVGWFALRWSRPVAPVQTVAGSRGAQGTRPEVVLTGDFRVVGATGHDAVPHRGDRVVAGPRGARMQLGGYCELTLDPYADIVVRGETGKEAVELDRGKLVSRITPGKGEYGVITPLGTLRVVGTEFVTTVDYPRAEKGDTDVARLKKAAVVTVMVLSGAVAYHFGDSTGLLGAGATQAFAGGEEAMRPSLPPGTKGFKGLVSGTLVRRREREFVLKIEKVAMVWKQSAAENPENLVGKEVLLFVPTKSRLLEQQMRTLAHLQPGAEILVEGFEVEGDRLMVMEVLRSVGAAGGEGERREKPRGEGEGERREKTVRREGEGEGHEKVVRREGEGEGHDRVVRREGEGEGREKVVRREGEGEGREKVVRREGEGEGHEKVVRREGEGREAKPEARTEGLRELEGTLYVYPPERRPEGLIAEVKVKQRVAGEGEGEPVERVVEIGIKDNEQGRMLAAEGTGRRVRLVGTLEKLGEEGPKVLVVKKYKAVEGGADEPKRRVKEGEGEDGERKVRREEGEGDREKPRVREGEREGEGDRKPEARKEAASYASREDVEGFRGILEGTLIGKGQDSFVLRVDKVAKVWQSSTAKKPEGLVGKTVVISLAQGEAPDERLTSALAELKIGDRVTAAAAHRDGNRLAIADLLRKAE